MTATTTQTPALYRLDELPLDRGLTPRWTVEQFEHMLDCGIISFDDHLELIAGQIVRRDRSAAGEDPMTAGYRHVYAVQVTQDLNPLFRPRGCYLRAQFPVSLPPRNHPEPDIAIVRGTPEDYLDRYPTIEDILCLIEVSDASLRRDTTTKLQEYADTNVAMYVVLSVPDRSAAVLTDPVPGEGRYATRLDLDADGTLALPTVTGPTVTGPAVEVRVGDLLRAA